jgi:tetratricopeptide (TPR) repeat protein
MSRDLEEAYAAYGLDLSRLSKEEIGRRIRESTLAPQLTNGLELWVATQFHLSMFGRPALSMEELMQWVEVLYVADTDPYRTAIRRLLYTPDPSVHRAELDRLAHAPEFETALPRTQAWLASIYWRCQDPEAGVGVFKRALDLHPADTMLNFDCAYFLAALERWPEAIAYYHRALTTRPRTAGLWRSLAVAQARTGAFDTALESFARSIALQPDHAMTHVDRGEALVARADGEEATASERAADLAEAEASFRVAAELAPHVAIAQCRLGLCLQAQGRPAEALPFLRRGHELGLETPGWDQPSKDWLEACEAALEAPTP